MEKKEILDVVCRMMEQSGPSAELLAGESMDHAFELCDAACFDDWRQVAEAIAAVRFHPPDGRGHTAS